MVRPGKDFDNDGARFEEHYVSHRSAMDIDKDIRTAHDLRLLMERFLLEVSDAGRMLVVAYRRFAGMLYLAFYSGDIHGGTAAAELAVGRTYERAVVVAVAAADDADAPVVQCRVCQKLQQHVNVQYLSVLVPVEDQNVQATIK